MAAIWIVSEESTLPATLAHHVQTLGEVWLGVPERAAFKERACARSADPRAVSPRSARVMTRSSGCSRSCVRSRSSAAPPRPCCTSRSDAEPSRASRIERLFDDRTVAVLGFPLDPDELVARAARAARRERLAREPARAIAQPVGDARGRAALRRRRSAGAAPGGGSAQRASAGAPARRVRHAARTARPLRPQPRGARARRVRAARAGRRSRPASSSARS